MSEFQENCSSQPTPLERLILLVERILADTGRTRPLLLDARLSELGLSSMKMVSLMLAIEVEFDVSIPQAEITPDNFESLRTVEAMIHRLLGITG